MKKQKEGPQHSAPPDKAPASHPHSWEEIPRVELQSHGSQLRDALEAVCKSAPFRTSPKSCEFLRHIVWRSLEGDTDVLKERLIGMALLGRDANYDTATDASVRVRANDVRKRLNAHNESLDDARGYCFGLPAGTYIPVFYRSRAEMPVPEPEQDIALSPRLSLYQLAAPTLAALFLCVICMRWESSQAHAFLRFWNRVIPDDRALLYLQPQPAEQGQDPMAIREVKLAAPLLNLAGQFHHRFEVISTPTQFAGAHGMLVYVGAAAGPPGQPDTLSGLPDAATADVASRFVVEGTPTGRKILDRQSLASSVAGGALLTIVNGPRPLVWIDGTDDTAIGMLVDRLCDQSAFPATLAESFQPDTMTQAVFAAAPPNEPTIVRKRLGRLHAVLANEP
jgi:hypothetical protein